MSKNNISKAKMIESENKKKLLIVNNKLNDSSGIYILVREDEQGFKYAYIGQAVKILTRLASHMTGYQHIDLSIKKHGFYSDDNIHGWKIGFLNFFPKDLDEKEQYYIKKYALAGYQLRNKTSGSQGAGKQQIDEYRPAKGYYDGIVQGKKTLARELLHIINKHLDISIKKPSKISEKAFEKFYNLLDENNHNRGD